MTQALKNGLQVTSEGEALILNENPTDIPFDDKISNNGGKGFLLAAKFYNSPNDTALLDPKNQNP